MINFIFTGFDLYQLLVKNIFNIFLFLSIYNIHILLLTNINIEL
jgi:hypothetical protein